MARLFDYGETYFGKRGPTFSSIYDLFSFTFKYFSNTDFIALLT